MSYAKVMASLNASSAASGVEVEVKKRAPDGSYIPADDRDFATADFDAELEAAVKAVQKLPREERLAYGAAMRVEGNAQFARGDHADAIRTYAKAMAGLDLSCDREATLRSVALPLWTNSAASYLALRRPRECIRCCDEALKIDGGHVKARLRKGAALLALDRYDEALACLEAIDENREAAALMRGRRARAAPHEPHGGRLREVPQRGVQRRSRRRAVRRPAAAVGRGRDGARAAAGRARGGGAPTGRWRFGSCSASWSSGPTCCGARRSCGACLVEVLSPL